MSEETAATPPAKFSRYRSVRHTMQPEKAVTEPTSEHSSDHDVQRTKSMSRYRRSRVLAKEQLGAPPIPEIPVPAVPALPMQRANTSVVRNPVAQNPAPAVHPSSVVRNPIRRVTEPASAGPKLPRPYPDEKYRAHTESRPRETEDERLRRKIKEYQEREGAGRLPLGRKEDDDRAHQLRKGAASQGQIDEEAKEKAAQRKAAQAHAEAEARFRAIKAREDAAQEKANAEARERALALTRGPIDTEAERLRRIEEENMRKLEEQKRKDLERLQRELDAAVPNPVQTEKLQSITSPMREKFSFFSRKKDSSKGTPPGSSSGTTSVTTTTNSDVPRLVEQSRKTEPPKKVEPPMVDAPKKVERPREVLQIAQGGGGIVPQTDAPISASNAGERRVLIRCKQSSINLPITPETTPSDIIYSAANIMTQNIIPSTAILLESYTQLGLERRVRRYEHVRDVMNSWDRDTQNSFILQNSDSPKFDTDLEASGVPREPPGNVTVYMYHSQKPGKWNKRFITLMPSGQIYMAKRSATKQSEKDAVNLCHLSDFDIYTPTAQQMRKTLKPPKKFCYAVKSQQKTTMFLSTENFVHFFSCEDEQLSETWYSAVQKWRSWYLVNRMGEGGRKTAKRAEQQGRPGTKAGPIPIPTDENPYTIGSFTPLFDLDNFGSGEDEDGSGADNSPRQVPFHLRNSLSISPEASKRESRRHPPPVSYRLPPEAEAEFTPTGLLGRTYTQRQREQKEKENANQTGPFMDGSSLLNITATHRTFSMASTKSKRPATSGDGLNRSNSRSKPKPLLDFTPQFKEAPQWDRTHKGRGVAPVSGVPLVEVATTPASGLDDIPKSTVFRRDTTVARPVTSVGRSAEAGGGFVSGGLVGGLNNPRGNGTVMNRGRVAYD